jgi:hypothetical protein
MQQISKNIYVLCRQHEGPGKSFGNVPLSQIPNATLKIGKPKKGNYLLLHIIDITERGTFTFESTPQAPFATRTVGLVDLTNGIGQLSVSFDSSSSSDDEQSTTDDDEQSTTDDDE